MRCPACQFPDSRVLDSRPVGLLDAIRRRRACGGCGARFTTYEAICEPAARPTMPREFYERLSRAGGARVAELIAKGRAAEAAEAEAR